MFPEFTLTEGRDKQPSVVIPNEASSSSSYLSTQCKSKIYHRAGEKGQILVVKLRADLI